MTTLAEPLDEPTVVYRRADQFKRDTTIIGHLQRICADDGVVLTTQRSIGATCGWDHKRVADALHSLADQGLLAFEDPAPFFEGQPIEVKRRLPTAIRLVKELIPAARESSSLGEYLQARKQTAPEGKPPQ